MHKKCLILFVMLTAITLISCGGYNEKSNPLSPEQVEITNMAQSLNSGAAELQPAVPAELKDRFDSFAESTAKFQNLCLRLGANSLETRKAFDQIMFWEAQISQAPQLASYADFNAKWQALRDGRLHELAVKLGYRPEKES